MSRFIVFAGDNNTRLRGAHSFYSMTDEYLRATTDLRMAMRSNAWAHMFDTHTMKVFIETGSKGGPRVLRETND